jgi:hypothetical protein
MKNKEQHQSFVIKFMSTFLRALIIVFIILNSTFSSTLAYSMSPKAELIESQDISDPEKIIKPLLDDYGKDHNLGDLAILRFTVENGRIYGVANSDKLLDRLPNNYGEGLDSVSGSQPSMPTLDFMVFRNDNQWELVVLNDPSAGQNVVALDTDLNLAVPFLQQADPPGDWNNTKNCGQTSSLMIYSFYNHTTPTAGNITSINTWLAQKTGDNRYNDANGYYTNVSLLKTMAVEYGSFAQSYSASGWSTNDLKREIQAGHPVIVEVWTNMDPTGDNVPHFMVLRGLRLDGSGNITNVIVNDPGRSKSSGQGENKIYTISTFITAWEKQNKRVVVITGQSGGVPVCSAPISGNPRDNSVLNNNQVTFSWIPPSCQGLDFYTFRVANHADIDNQPWIINHDVDKNATSQVENIPASYNGQTLYWAIWPHNSAGYGTKGGAWSFKIDTSIPPTPPSLPTGTWNVQYYRNKELSDQCSSTSFDRTFIFSDWGESAPASGCNSDNWGARFSRKVNFQGGNYTFAVEADDWGRIYVDGNLFVDKWNGASQHYEGHNLSAGNHDVVVEFADTSGGAKISAWWWGPGFEIPHDQQDTNQWYANYWINPTQWWDAFVNRNEGTGVLSHDWQNSSPGWDMPSDQFSAKFRRTVNFECGRYQFNLDHDDGAKFYLDGQLVVDRWSGAIGQYQFNLDISRGSHEVQVDYYENGGAAHISLDWQRISGCQPSSPTLNLPGNGNNLDWNTDATLSWNSAAGATEYYVIIQGGYGIELNSDWVTGNQWHIGGLNPGTYIWWVTARNEYGTSESDHRTFIVHEKPIDGPIADFSATPVSGTIPLSVTFQNLSSGSYTTCSWDFGDGTTSTSCSNNQTHTYSTQGIYTVKLSLTGSAGSNTAQKINYITVNPGAVCPSISYWKGEYWSNTTLSGNPTLCKDDFSLTFDSWGYGSPDTTLPEDFSARWTRILNFPANTYRFHLNHDDGARVYIDGNLSVDYWSSCCTWETTDVPISNGNHEVKVDYFDSNGAAKLDLWWEPLNISGWKGEYYNSPNFTGFPILVRDDPEINFDWKAESPDPLVQAEQFSVRWTKTVNFSAGQYVFTIHHDDGARLYIDDSLKFENWCSNCVLTETVPITLSSGNHVVKYEMYDNAGWAGSSLSWNMTFNAPTNLSTTAVSSTQINLSWTDNSSDETNFRVERSPDGTNSWSEIATVPANTTTYQNTGLVANTNYYYRVRAYRSSDSSYSNYSNTANVKTPNPPLAAPSNLTAAVASQTQINLSWTDNSNDETIFRIERSLDGSSGWSEIITVAANSTTYQSTGLSCGTKYYYRVRAFRNSDTSYSDYSNIANATTTNCPLAAPSNLTVSAASQTQVNLSWTDNSTDETNFRIERSPDGASGWTEVGSANANAASYQNTGLSCGTKYYYRVRAYRSSDTSYSSYTSVVNATTLACAINAPSNLTSSAASQLQINLSWTDNSTDETNFRVERSLDGSSGWTEIGTANANATSYQNTGLSCGAKYYYRIRAYRSSDSSYSNYTNSANATTAACTLAAPSNLTATAASQTQINLSWVDNSSDETNFRVERSADGTSGWSEIGTAAANATSYQNTGLTANTTYYYRVRAYRSSDTSYSTYSNTANAKTTANPVQPPSNLTATAASQTQINLSWVDNSSDETNFRVERSADGTNGWTEIGTANANATSYQNTGLSCGTKYYYRVRAYRSNDTSYSAYSNTANVTTTVCSLTAPSNLTATAASETQINLSWTDNSSDETNFRIERSADGTSGWSEIGTAAANATSYQNTTLSCGTRYYYRIRAYRSSDASYSVYSSSANATTSACTLAAPSNLTATAASQTQINLSWVDNSSDETNFRVERSADGTSGWSEIGTAAANATSYQNTGLTANTTYYYRVRAYRSSDTSYSTYSNIANTKTLPVGNGVPLLVSPSSNSVSLGQTFDIVIQVQAGNNQVDGVSAYVNFDPSVIKVNQITKGSLLNLELENNYNNTTGQINLSLGTMSNFPTGTITVGTITFQALSQATNSSISFSSTTPRKSDITFGGASILGSTQPATVSVINNASVSGSVNLQGRSTKPSAAWSIPLRVELTLQGQTTPAYSLTPITDQNGVFTLSNITPGSYTVKTKSRHTLQNVSTTTLQTGSNTIDFGTLKEGDANDDNGVTMLDFSVLASTFGKTKTDLGFDVRADFNEDGTISMLDFSLLATNFGQYGSSSPSNHSVQVNTQLATASQNVVLTALPSTKFVKVGDTFEITIQIQSGTQSVDGAQVSLDFDPSRLKVLSMTGNTSTFPLVLLNTYDNTNGTIDYAAGTVSYFPSGNLDLLQIQFEALTDGPATPIAFHLQASRTSDVTYGGTSVLSKSIPATIIFGPEIRLYLPIAFSK